MGFKFSEAYPEEYNVYIKARERYNENEEKISALENELAENVEPENIAQ